MIKRKKGKIAKSLQHMRDKYYIDRGYMMELCKFSQKVNKLEKNFINFLQPYIRITFRTFYILHFTFYILILLSCSPTTDNDKGNLSGTVNLEGELDHSGVQVGLYDLCELDADIMEANDKWSQIGFEINQRTEFDHRENIPLKIAETDKNGNFIFSNIGTGDYNLAIVKPGWGIKYICDLEVSGKDYIIPEIIELSLLIELEGDISGTHIFESGKSYFTDAVNFVPESEIILESGTNILIAGNNLSIYGSITVEGDPDSYFLITNASGMDEISPDISLPERTGQVFFRSTVAVDLTLSYGKISYLETGLLNETNLGIVIELHHLRINHCGSGIKLSNLASCDITNCVISDCNRDDNGGINIEETDTGIVSYNIITHSTIGIRMRHRTDFDVNNNYIYGNEIGFKGLHFTGRIEHNEFTRNENADISICGTYGAVDEPMEIEYNNFSSSRGITSFYNSSYGSNCRVSSLKYNNFSNSISFIRISSGYPEIDARYCYFGGLNNEVEIDARIYDDDEDEEYPLVDFSGFVIVKIGAAGIE